MGAAAAATPATPRHLYLVDASGYIFRAFHALPPLTRPDGTPIGAVYGFTTMLLKLLDETDADAVVAVFDAGRTSFRNDLYDAYKAHRPAAPEELAVQFPLMRDAARAIGLPCVEVEGYEADDVIATYARAAAGAGAEVTIVSSDKDLMQLVGGSITMLDPMKLKRIDTAAVRERFGVAPDKVIDVMALAGDSVDNVPGVPGIGVKTAAALIAEYGDLDVLLAHADEIKQPKRREALIVHADNARLSRDLVRLCDTVPLPEPLANLILRPPDQEKLLAFVRTQGFRALAERLETRGLAAPATPVAPPATEAAIYEVVLDRSRLAAWIEIAWRVGTVALEVLTRDPAQPTTPLVGIALATAPGRACYVPLGHTLAQGDLDLSDAGPDLIARDEALAVLKPLLEADGVLKIGANLKAAAVALGGHGIALRALDDVGLLSYVLEGGLHGHGIEELARLHLEHTTGTLKDVLGTGQKRIGFDGAPLEASARFGGERADLALRLHPSLRHRIVTERMTTLYETVERPLIAVLADMERRGVRVDARELARLSADFATRIAALETDIHSAAGRTFTIGSPKQLGEVLFDEMGLAGARRSSKSGAYATGADVLEGLAAQGHALPALVLEWRQLTKLKSTYADALVAQIDPASGRVHTSYAMTVASTGRLSSNDPNLQNIPVRTEEGRKIRRAFIADEGMVFLSADYSQIELRLLAHVAQIDALKGAFREGTDIHALTASQVFGVPIEGMDPVVRRNAKAINFGIIYGISPFGLARQLGIPQADARAYIDAYFERYPGIQAYMETCKTYCRKHGYVRTLFGRKCHMPGIHDRNPAVRSFNERAAINAPLQGAAADIIKRAMVRVPTALAARRLSGRMLLQVHDELLLEVPRAEVDATAKVVRTVMAGAAALDVPLVVDIGIGATWEEAH